MKFKQGVVASLLAAGAIGAQAAAVAPGGDLGTLGTDAELFGSLMTGGAFSDNYAFTLGGASSVTGSVAAFFGAPSLSAVMLDGMPATLSASTTGYSFSFAGLAAGDYLLTVTGTAPGFSSYIGSISAESVPEPQSLAMMLAGLGAMGAVAVRRRKGL